MKLFRLFLSHLESEPECDGHRRYRSALRYGTGTGTGIERQRDHAKRLAGASAGTGDEYVRCSGG